MTAVPGDHRLPPHLRALRERIEGYARGFGLDPYETVFEVLDGDELNMVAAYGGFPTRYPHWRFGMEYERLSRSSEYGLSRIYELVINNDPSYAYLQASNQDVDQKLVMAHVFGHADFFKHNYAFRHTNRKMMDAMANHATRVRRHQDRLGVEPVETFVDRCLSLENLIDPQSPFVKRRAERGDPEPGDRPVAVGFRTDREYMRRFINPPAALAAEQERLDAVAGPPPRRPPRPRPRPPPAGGPGGGGGGGARGGGAGGGGRGGGGPATSSSSSSSRRRSSGGSRRSSGSSATRPTTSRPRPRPRS